MILKIILILSFSVISFTEATGEKLKKELEKRAELDGIYRIENPDGNFVVTILDETSGNPPLQNVASRPLKDGIIEQEWSIMTSGPPVARVASIFNLKDTTNVISNEYAFTGTSFIRTWQIIEIGDGLVILRNLGLCLTRLRFGGKLERRDCGKGQNVTKAQKWRLVYLRELSTNEPRVRH